MKYKPHMSNGRSLYQHSTDEQVVTDDFRRLYNAYWERLFKQMIRILPDEDEAADIVQQTFANLWVIRDRIPQIKAPKSFLFIMARNLAFKRLKDNLKDEVYRDYYASHFEKCIYQTQQEVEFRELNSLLERSIDNLPQKMREVFLLSRKSDLSYVEIAQQLNISDTTVKKQIHNAIKILKLKIEKQYFPYVVLTTISIFF